MIWAGHSASEIVSPVNCHIPLPRGTLGTCSNSSSTLLHASYRRIHESKVSGQVVDGYDAQKQPLYTNVFKYLRQFGNPNWSKTPHMISLKWVKKTGFNRNNKRSWLINALRLRMSCSWLCDMRCPRQWWQENKMCSSWNLSDCNAAIVEVTRYTHIRNTLRHFQELR